MLFSHAILRADLGDYTLRRLAQAPIYTFLLILLNDNMDGRAGAFSIQNVVRMALIFDRYPGEWHGNKSISLVFSHLNKIYRPINNFEVCVFGDDTVFFDKVLKKATTPPLNWMKHQRAKFNSLSDENK